MDYVIEAENVGCVYPHEVSNAGASKQTCGIFIEKLKIPSFGVTAVIGPSGSGKSTLVGLVSGLRDWKNRFPKEWQEVIHHDLSGEKHIADVKTPDGLIIEFQHSAINPEELASRESFYKNMIWVVDGQRLSREAQRLSELLSSNWSLEMCVVFEDAHKRFPKSWLHNTVPVYFDIGHPDYLICRGFNSAVQLH